MEDMLLAGFALLSDEGWMPSVVQSPYDLVDCAEEHACRGTVAGQRLVNLHIVGISLL